MAIKGFRKLVDDDGKEYVFSHEKFNDAIKNGLLDQCQRDLRMGRRVNVPAADICIQALVMVYQAKYMPIQWEQSPGLAFL